MKPESFCVICGSVYPSMRKRQKGKCGQCGGRLRRTGLTEGRQGINDEAAIMFTSTDFRYTILDRTKDTVIISNPGFIKKVLIKIVKWRN